MIKQTAPKVLLISLEFPTWRSARSYSYWFNLGLEEGFEANGIDYFTLTVGHHYAEKKASWLDYARELCAGQQFDQAWVEIVHSDLDEPFLDWLTTVAPVRIAWSCECLVLSPEEWATNPRACQIREETLAKRLKYFTHIVTVDEVDVDRFNRSGPVPAMWLAGGVMPKRFVCSQPPPPRHNIALFYGTLYGKRKSWLEDRALAGLIVRPSVSLEDFTPYPKMFDALQMRTQQVLESGKIDLPTLSSYLETLRYIRRESFAVWLETLRIGCAVVNLPQLSRAYAGRVIEGMAAGRPVITWEIPDRPHTRSLFEDGKEILLYSKDSPEQLGEHIRHIQSDPSFGRRIATNARMKLQNLHTTEKFVREIYEWASGCALLTPRVLTGYIGEQHKDTVSSGELKDVPQSPVDTPLQRGDWALHIGANISSAEVYPGRRVQAGRATILVGRARLWIEITTSLTKTWIQTRFPVFSRFVSAGWALLRGVR